MEKENINTATGHRKALKQYCKGASLKKIKKTLHKAERKERFEECEGIAQAISEIEFLKEAKGFK